MLALLFALHLAASVAVVTLAVLSLAGRLPRNVIAGIRTEYTMSNDVRWAAVHRAAAPTLIFGGVALASASLAFLPFAVVGKVPGGLGLAVFIALAAGMLLTVLLASITGVRDAKRRGL